MIFDSCLATGAFFSFQSTPVHDAMYSIAPWTATGPRWVCADPKPGDSMYICTNIMCLKQKHAQCSEDFYRESFMSELQSQTTR